MNNISNMAYNAFINVNEIAAQVAVISAYSRVTSGALALGVKGASKVTEYVGQKDISNSLDHIGDGCAYFATRDVNPELGFTAFIVMSLGMMKIMDSVSSMGNTTFSLASDNKALAIAAPAAILGVLSIGSRVTAGALALGAKGTSQVADYAGQRNLSKSLNQAGDRFINYATKSIKPELELAVGLTAYAAFLTAGTFFYRGITKLAA